MRAQSDAAVKSATDDAVGTDTNLRPTCMSCVYHDEEGALPVCTLHRKYSDPSWLCGDYEGRADG